MRWFCRPRSSLFFSSVAVPIFGNIFFTKFFGKMSTFLLGSYVTFEKYNEVVACSGHANLPSYAYFCFYFYCGKFSSSFYSLIPSRILLTDNNENNNDIRWPKIFGWLLPWRLRMIPHIWLKSGKLRQVLPARPGVYVREGGFVPHRLKRTLQVTKESIHILHNATNGTND